jgi:hypothetical protein
MLVRRESHWCALVRLHQREGGGAVSRVTHRIVPSHSVLVTDLVTRSASTPPSSPTTRMRHMLGAHTSIGDALDLADVTGASWSAWTRQSSAGAERSHPRRSPRRADGALSHCEREGRRHDPSRARARRCHSVMAVLGPACPLAYHCRPEDWAVPPAFACTTLCRGRDVRHRVAGEGWIRPRGRGRKSDRLYVRSTWPTEAVDAVS